jgi:tripartite-type tricarboxylate transporter receptor subunit TctC
MKELIGQPIIVENVTGADGSIGVGRAALARPDGYTIVLGILDTHVLNGAFYSLQYDVLNDFAPVAPLITNPIILFARKTLPANDLRESTALRRESRRSASGSLCGSYRRKPGRNSRSCPIAEAPRNAGPDGRPHRPYRGSPPQCRT